MSISDALAKLGDEPSGETMPVEAVELLGSLMAQNTRDAHWTSNQLMESFQRSWEKAEAELAAVRAGVYDLLNGPYAPNPNLIGKALWPSEETVNRYRKGDAS